MSDFVPSYGAPQIVNTSLVFPFAGETFLVGLDAELLPVTALRELGASSEAIVFGTLNGLVCEMRVWPADTAIPSGIVKGDYRQLWGRWTQGQLDALSRSRQLAAWFHQNRFCGVCGQTLKTRLDEPARECPSCGFKAYPRISPVCIGLVLKGTEMLLARSPHFPPGVYSTLAGFLEAGESAENCLRREIREESGIEIQNIRWFGSQAWPYPHSLMIGFIVDYAAGELVAQESEIEDIGWFEMDELPRLPHPSTIAFQMIDFARREIGSSVLNNPLRHESD
ncbi:MAG: NAD(+) diphosphatase [Glaciimonas sp.]|nr:NAD(+) diphosphatase [Glaciimonas sp.]